MINDPLKIWLVVTLVFVIFEMTLPFFGCSLLAVAALITAGVTVLTPSWEIQAFVFALISILFTALLRPVIVRKLQSKTHLPTRTEALVGKAAIATENFVEGLGRITVEGQDWKAEGAEDFALGTHLVVKGSDGIVLKVGKDIV
jgi:membrane protein implicated in regulation of membrane protease activity